jgi:hypothetical protein
MGWARDISKPRKITVADERWKKKTWGKLGRKSY